MTCRTPKTFEKSFASVALSKHWHPTKNGDVNPRDVGRAVDKKFWFLCDECGHSFDKMLSNVTRKGSWCPYCSTTNWRHCGDKGCAHCFERSFASHSKAKYWHPTKNTKTALDVSACSKDKCWFKCFDCHHEFQMAIEVVRSGCWCTYCSTRNWKHCGEKKCEHCFRRSFASHPRARYWHKTKNDEDVLEVAMHARGDFWFKCDVCDHDFKLAIYNITGKNAVWCCYCSLTNWKHCGEYSCYWCWERSFASHPKADCLISDDESLLRSARFSHKTADFQCEECANVLTMKLSDVSKGSWCSFCKNKTELKMLKWLKNNFSGLTVIHQATFEWARSEKGNCLPYDFYIEELEAIISLDGDQHFRQVQNWTSPEIAQKRDVEKMLMALQNGLRIIRVYQDDVWRDRCDWDTKLRDLLVCGVDALSFVPTTRQIVIDVYQTYKNECQLFS